MNIQLIAREPWRPQRLRKIFLRIKRSSRKFVGWLLHDLVAWISLKEKGAIEQWEAFSFRLAAIDSLVEKRSLGSVLLDATWHNPNYWLRYAILRSALGLKDSIEIGVLGPHRPQNALRVLKILGINNTVKFENFFGVRRLVQSQAELFLRPVSHHAEILQWKLPFDFPASFVYDGILKRQRSATVDLQDPFLVDYVAEAIGSINAANEILDHVKPELVVLSHSIEFRYGAIAWCALRRKIPVVVAFGNFGVLRYCRLDSSSDFLKTVDCPSASEIAELNHAQREAFAEQGRSYLGTRLAGGTSDIGAKYAFGFCSAEINRASICDAFGWSKEKPIIAVYASNWFDYPHSLGLANFTEFVDWLKVTLSAAGAHSNFNWLFRAHPCDRWYGGVTLSDLMTDAEQTHIRLCPPQWNGADIQSSVDGLVTVHGTAGLEYAAAGKPVLLADRGWYHEVGFAYLATSREHYVALLDSGEWLVNKKGSRESAAVFSGIYFGRPNVSRGITLNDDSEQEKLLPNLIDLLANKRDVSREGSGPAQSEVQS